jgi:hypothetical protein
MPNGDGIHRESGDAIEGERIACQFRRINKVEVNRGSGAHRSQRTSLDDAYCTVTKPLRARGLV